jgi:hypothetical protein
LSRFVLRETLARVVSRCVENISWGVTSFDCSIEYDLCIVFKCCRPLPCTVDKEAPAPERYVRAEMLRFVSCQTLNVMPFQRRSLQYNASMHVTQHASVPSLYGIATSNRHPPLSLYKLLLDEESAQMCQLPRASDTKDSKLDQSPSDDAGVCALGLIAELGFALL